ncbi:hypothetical protein EWM64_g9074 [Hericium alpestre]|uniref:Helicase C-terminal domain-containing protein n=1 Tax=Hericium alpestre TaxID=135208 RepID=A0A4Y9ZN45_9AGAM|nr:hypothetical protein EWM64_g9074 [Hericium alpestre]
MHYSLGSDLANSHFFYFYFQDFYLNFCHALIHPTTNNDIPNVVYPVDLKTYESYPSRKLDTVIVIARHHLALDDAPPLSYSADPDNDNIAGQDCPLHILPDDVLTAHGIKFIEMHSNHKALQRPLILEEFWKQDCDSAHILIMSSVGGVGLNMTFFNIMIILDVVWDDSADSQAIGHIWRQMQQKHMHIYRLIGSDTPDVVLNNLSFDKGCIMEAFTNKHGIFRLEDNQDESKLVEMEADATALREEDVNEALKKAKAKAPKKPKAPKAPKPSKAMKPPKAKQPKDKATQQATQPVTLSSKASTMPPAASSSMSRVKSTPPLEEFTLPPEESTLPPEESAVVGKGKEPEQPRQPMGPPVPHTPPPQPRSLLPLPPRHFLLPPPLPLPSPHRTSPLIADASVTRDTTLMDESGQEQAQEQAQERFRHLSLDAPPTQQLVEQDGAEPPTMDIDDIFGGGLTPLEHRTSSMDEDSFPSPPPLRQKRKPSASPPKSESNRPKRPVIEPSHIVIEPHVRHDEIERRRLEQAAHEEEEREEEEGVR